MKPIIAGDVWETISIDISGPYPPSHGFVYILSVQCLFSKFVQAFPMRKQTAIEVASILFGNLFTKFGFPAHIISDQGRQFDGELFHQLCKFANINKLRTTPYKASTNGQVERWHRTLHSILAKTVQDNHRNWHFHIPSVVMAYNSTKNKVTQFTPNLLFFGREVRLPVDLAYGLQPENRCHNDYNDFVEELVTRQQNDFVTARQNLGLAAQ